MVKIQTNKLVSEINNTLKIYNEQIVDGMKKANDECMKQFVKDTKSDAPRGKRKTNKYYTHITSKKTLDTPNRRINTWYVKDPEYHLTHLIKNGHATVNGGRTKGNDFITKNYEKMTKNFEQKINEVIKK